MIDRYLKLIVALTFLLILLQAVTGVVTRLVESALSGMTYGASRLGSFLTGIVFVAGMVCFLAGLIVRLRGVLRSRDPRGAREHASRERAVRHNVRRPAEGVSPVEVPGRGIVDEDPAFDDEED